MRFLLILLLSAVPAMAWEFRPLPVCTLKNAETELEVAVTYDPASREYAIALTRPEGWPTAPVFALQFEGGRGLTISTGRHVLSTDGKTLTVTDTGFGNVLNGIEFNTVATALLGQTAVPFPLTGAAPGVQAFRDCTRALSV